MSVSGFLIAFASAFIAATAIRMSRRRTGG